MKKLTRGGFLAGLVGLLVAPLARWFPKPSSFVGGSPIGQSYSMVVYDDLVDTNDEITLADIEAAIDSARSLVPPIRPVLIDGKEQYLIFPPGERAKLERWAHESQDRAVRESLRSYLEAAIL